MVCSSAKSYENDPQITLPKISAKYVIPDIKYLEDYGKGHMALLKWMAVLHYFTKTFNIFPLNLTWDSDFLFYLLFRERFSQRFTIFYRFENSFHFMKHATEVNIFYHPRATRCGRDIVTLLWFRLCVRACVRPSVPSMRFILWTR